MAKSTKRFSSRPAILPSTKDRVNDAVLDGLDRIRDALDESVIIVNQGFPRRQLSGKVLLKIQKGRPNTIWVAYARYQGLWSYQQLHKSAVAMKKELPRRQLVSIALRYAEIEDDGEIGEERWMTIGPIQVWASAIAQLVSMTTPKGRDSLTRRYRSSVVTEVSIQIASHATTGDEA